MKHPAWYIAAAFHEAYERLAPECGYETRKDSAVPWSEVPKENKELMYKVVCELLKDKRIQIGDHFADRSEGMVFND